MFLSTVQQPSSHLGYSATNRALPPAQEKRHRIDTLIPPRIYPLRSPHKESAQCRANLPLQRANSPSSTRHQMLLAIAGLLEQSQIRWFTNGYNGWSDKLEGTDVPSAVRAANHFERVYVVEWRCQRTPRNRCSLESEVERRRVNTRILGDDGLICTQA